MRHQSGGASRNDGNGDRKTSRHHPRWAPAIGSFRRLSSGSKTTGERRRIATVRRADLVIHSKSGSPRDSRPDGLRGGDPRYLRRTCEESLKNLGIEALDMFCMSRVDPKVPVEESVGGMAELVREGKTRFISLSECSAESLRRGSTVHPLASLQMEYSLFSRDPEQQGQIEACKELGMAMMAYAVLGRGMLSAQVPNPEHLAPAHIPPPLPPLPHP